MKDWIVIAGQLIDNTEGGGFEFFGPYTEQEAKVVRAHMMRDGAAKSGKLCLSVQLIGANLPERYRERSE